MCAIGTECLHHPWRLSQGSESISMKIGIFTKTFERDTFEGVLDAVKACGYACVQLNWESAGLDPMPGRLGHEVCDRIREAGAPRLPSEAATAGDA